MEIRSIRDYAEAFSGYAFSSTDLVDVGFPVLKIGNIQNHHILKEIESFYNKEITEKIKKYQLQKGDFLIAMTGAGSVGKAGKMIDFEEGYLVNQRVAIIRPDLSKTDPDYLFYYFSMGYVEKYLYNLGIGAGQPNISANDILKTKVSFPTLVKQKKIGYILSIYDNYIENNNKRIKILEKIAEELYKEWFLRFRYPKYKTRKIEKGIPVGWKIKRIKDYGKIETGKTPSTEITENYGGNIMFIKTPDMHNNIFVIESEEYLTELGHNSQAKKLLPEISIMVSCIGTAGVVSINYKPAHTNQQINSIILNDDKYLEWMYFTCKSLKDTIESFGSTGSTMTNLSKGKFEKLKVVHPDEELIESFHQFAKPIFEQIKLLMLQNINLKRQFDLLLSRLMSGKLEINNNPE